MDKKQTYITSLKNKDITLIKDDGSQYLLFNDDLELKHDKKASAKSLLRYPGGKTRAVDLITALIPKYVNELCSPFLGGGSIELACTAKKIMVYGYDIFTPLVEFWQCLLEDAHKLANEVEKFFPLAKDKFYELQKIQSLFQLKFQRAAVFYVLNRSSFSGSTLSGGMSPGHPRFTVSSIQRLRSFHNPYIRVNELDFAASISAHQNVFLYLDPPYLIKNNLYGKNGDTHKDFDHLKLYEILSVRENWILSYNNCDEIIKLYQNYKIVFPVWKYGMSSDKRAREVLIFSRDIQKYHNL